MKLTPSEVQAATYAAADHVRRQQLDGRPVLPAVADLLARLEHATTHPTVRETRHETSAPETTRNKMDAKTTYAQNSPAAPELIGTGRAAAILGWNRRRVIRRHADLGGVMIDGRLLYEADRIAAIAANLNQGDHHA
ncbi:hypothetical protein [Mycolicibacter sinensis]|uniref:hypothetical protein n=1 Tax=Mycolicibacter sinensis (strain JDM601) TaxID=875328 RepID=UPI0007EA92FE|nr:hypothetical protein [Mycolicibacter sinensis]OBH20826.1 hypothetical protein A5694_15180 [Mycolicibacter sinensis]